MYGSSDEPGAGVREGGRGVKKLKALGLFCIKLIKVYTKFMKLYKGVFKGGGGCFKKNSDLFLKSEGKEAERKI